MTNAEKYLKDNVGIEEFSRELGDYFYNKFINSESMTIIKMENVVKEFLYEQVKPTLTEDERVILRNLDSHTFEDIKRNRYGFLELYDECLNEWVGCQFKDSLFQFIKERRRIFYKRVVRR